MRNVLVFIFSLFALTTYSQKKDLTITATSNLEAEVLIKIINNTSKNKLLFLDVKNIGIFYKSLFWNYNLLIIREMNAICVIASDENIVFSTSLNILRLKFNHPKDLSTCQRFFCGINPVVDSGFCITSTVHL